MKKLLFSVILAFLFFLTAQNAHAYDLESTCGSSFCTLSSHDPVFSSDTKWVPGKSETREVQISNSDSVSKEIYIKARNIDDDTKELDSYMNITLSDGTISIWQGTLEDFINAGKIQIVNLGGGDDFELEIEAEMISSVPNDKMGMSSVFNFSFGFEGENRQVTNSTNENGSGSNDSGGDGDGGSSGSESTTTDVNTQAGFFGNFFGDVFAAFDDGESATDEAEREVEEAEKDVLGAGIDTCKENYLWILFLAAQILFAILFFIKRFKEKVKLILAGHTGLLLLSIVAVYLLSCVLWPILISIFIFAVPFPLLIFINRIYISDKISS